MAQKSCSKCGTVKPLRDFYTNHRATDGRRGDCKTCVLQARRKRYEAEPEVLKARVLRYRAEHAEKVRKYQQTYNRVKGGRDPDLVRAQNRDRNLRKYGLTPASYDDLFLGQGQCCAICGQNDPGRFWCIDHDHRTGKVRGILCWHCNVALGHFRDDPTAIIAAVDYLIRNDEAADDCCA